VGRSLHPTYFAGRLEAQNVGEYVRGHWLLAATTRLFG
jgi:hypothetical protein